MGIIAAKLMDDGESLAAPATASESLTGSTVAGSGIEVPDGFVPATKAQVAYWRQVCGALSLCGATGMRDTDWPPDVAPTRLTLRALEERRLIVRRSGAWHLRRDWYATLTLLRRTAVPTPPLTLAERPALNLPTFAELEQWELVCRWLDTQPGQRARLPILDVPSVGAVSADLLRGMRKYRLVRHAADCTWRLSRTWKARLSALWQGVVKAEGERKPAAEDTPAPYSLAAGIDTWYLNRIDADGLPPLLRIALDEFQSQAKDEDDEVETPWQYDGTRLLMYRAGVSTTQGGGVSWSYILRNPSLALLIRKAPLGGIIAQARLGSACLWRRTPLVALNELDALVRGLWQLRLRGGSWVLGHAAVVPSVSSMSSPDARGDNGKGKAAHWQVSQVHLAHDVANAPLAVEQLDCYISRSRKQAAHDAARADLEALYASLNTGLSADEWEANGFDWDALYADDGDDGLFDDFDVFAPGAPGGFDRGRAAPAEPVPVEDRAARVHRWARRLSGITWSPGAPVSFVAYDKVLEGRLRGKSHMEAIWKANGWDGKAPVTRHEARLRRDALRTLGIPESQLAEFDDPWQMLDRLQDLYGYVVGRPTATTVAMDCPQVVDVAWLRRVVPDPHEANRSRWPTDPVWAVVQAPQFTDVSAEVRQLIRREVRSQHIAQRDRGGYGLLVSRTALAFADPKFWNLEYAMGQWYQVFTEESEKPGKAFHELVRQRRRDLGLSVPPEGRVLPFRGQPLATLSVIDRAIDQDGEDIDSREDPDKAEPLALLRTIRRLEEIEAALEVVRQAHAQARPRQIQELERAYAQELKVYEAIYERMHGEDAG